ncbi:FAD-binding protein [Frigidibacter sp.]|uniref:FAD-binding protein n=1 Tax=Frigidibacter sp. TaxID=2586418 RepID=UPI002733DE9D|nr:FAD-binding protein [Frigidibacter sp.]MDP3342541.1 FAD-binding protein [Frigidibacter sp.]
MRPTSEDDLAALVRSAPGPLRVQGGGTRGPLAEGDLLETGGLSGIVLYEPAALTLVVRAGTPLAEVQAALAAEGQRLPFEPGEMGGLLARPGASTIGGVVATNASGPRRVQAGACRDSLIGVRFVDGRGTVVKNGGRVMKNVTGYDLVKLLAGSHGTLGVLTEVAFKLQPIPPATATLILPDLTPARAVAAMSAALGSPFDVTGAAHLPGTGTLIRLEGLAASIAYRVDRLLVALAPFGQAVVERDPAAAAALWQSVRDGAPFQGREGDVWRISVRPSDGPEVAARLGGEVVMDWGGGLIWALYPAGMDARAQLAGIAGHATRVRGASPDIPAFPPEPAPVAALTAALRAQFDPRGILNAGRG